MSDFYNNAEEWLKALQEADLPVTAVDNPHMRTLGFRTKSGEEIMLSVTALRDGKDTIPGDIYELMPTIEGRRQLASLISKGEISFPDPRR